MHRTRGGHTASKPIDHMRSTQHHVRHSEAHIWIEFRVKQLTLMPATCREHRGYAQHKTGAKELGTIPCALTTREATGCGTWPRYNTIQRRQLQLKIGRRWDGDAEGWSTAYRPPEGSDTSVVSSRARLSGLPESVSSIELSRKSQVAGWVQGGDIVRPTGPEPATFQF